MVGLRDKSWDFVKFVLMFLVVFGHVCPADVEKWTPVTRIVGLFVMPLFFFVSGYFQSKIVDAQKLVQKFRKTMFRLLIPLVTWGGLYVFLSVLKLYQIPDLCSSSSVQEYVLDVIHFLKYTPFYIAGFYWFLTALLLCIVVGSCLSLLISVWRSIGLVVAILSPLFFCSLPHTLIELYHFSFVWLFYIGGMFFREYEHIILTFLKQKYCFSFFFIMLIVVVCIGKNYHPRNTFYYASNLFIDTSMTFIIRRYGIHLIAVMTLLYWIKYFYNRFSNVKLITKFANYGQDTLFIYCSHFFFLEFLYKPSLMPLLYHKDGTLLMVICEHVVGIFISAILYALLQYLCGICHRSRIASFLFLGVKQ